MKVRLLGTGAAEGVPAFYSNTRVSNYARQHGGREIRSRAGALLDNHIKIDLGPDTLFQLNRDRLDARNWSALFFTHSHDDHFAIEELQYGLYPFSEEGAMPFTIFGNASVTAKLNEKYPDWPIDIQTTKSFEPNQWGEYTVTPIAARHIEDEDAHNLIFQEGGKSFLYATDTGYWLEPTWEFLKNVQLDCLVMECNSGRVDSEYTGHHTLKTFLAAIERLRKENILKKDSQVVSTHHSHNGDMTYAEIVEALAPHQIVAGYDGLEIEI